MTAARRPFRVELSQDAKGEFRWHLRAPNGRIVADGSEGYKTRYGVRMAVKRLFIVGINATETVEMPNFAPKR